MDSVVTLNRTGGTGDPNRATLAEAADTLESVAPDVLSPVEKLQRMAQASGDISAAFPPEKLAEIGETAVSNYERDLRDRKDWEDVAREALAACSQEELEKGLETKDFPWPNASNMRWPLLTIATLQYNARMYPALVKGDEAVLCKVIGGDNGKPRMAPNPQTGEIQPVPQIDPATGQLPVDPATGQPKLEPQWEIPPGGKAKRARRVADYLNTVLFYRMPNWEADTDGLLMQLPAVGCMFRKIWPDSAGKPQSATVSALDIVVPSSTRSLQTALRITEKQRDVYPHEIMAAIQSGYYRYANAVVDALAPYETSQENDGARLLLEQHCLWDFDGDNIPEPYIVTLDHGTRTVLRIEPNFGLGDIEWTGSPDEGGRATGIKRRQYYVKYPMFPHPKGKFYDIGLGHLLKRMGDGIDTMLNQLIDAGTAQTAGGGFIGSGVRLQSRGARGQLSYQPGKYFTVDVPGDQLKAAIVEKTLPNVSPVTFQLLELILGAARDIAGIKDVITGEASNQGQVGTTLALIEQGLQVFNATAKRVFRAAKEEYELLADCIADFGGEDVAADYMEVLDDPQANFEQDFDRKGLDIRPISDPSSVTRMQKMAKAQFQLGLLPQVVSLGGDGQEILKRVLEAVDTEDIEKIFPPKQVDPMQAQMQLKNLMENLRLLSATADEKEASAQAKGAKAMLDAIEAASKRFELSTAAGQHGMQMGAIAALTNAPPGPPPAAANGGGA